MLLKSVYWRQGRVLGFAPYPKPYPSDSTTAAGDLPMGFLSWGQSWSTWAGLLPLLLLPRGVLTSYACRVSQGFTSAFNKRVMPAQALLARATH